MKSTPPSQKSYVPVEEITVERLRENYDAGLWTVEEVVHAFLCRIEKIDPSLNAFTSLNPNALEEAKTIDRRRTEGEELGPLAGVPIIVKESIDVAGLPSTMGWAPLSKKTGGMELIPKKDAVVVGRLRNAGAIILGKGNIPAFSADPTRANSSWAGPTFNAIDRRFCPGGSSSGVASAVSANLAVLGVAEDSGGSIQNPAAAQAIVGVKPTFGLVPTTGTVPLGGSTRDVVGPHARTVRDTALMMDILAGYSILDPKTLSAIGHRPPGGSYTEKLRTDALEAKRVGLYGQGWSSLPLSPETSVLYHNVLDKLREQGAILVTDPFANTDFSTLSPPESLKALVYGYESVAFDLDHYLRGYGPEAPLHSLKDLKFVTGKNPFSENEVLGLIWKILYSDVSRLSADCDIYSDFIPESAEKKWEFVLEELSKMKIPVLPENIYTNPDLSDYLNLRERYLDIFNQVMSGHDLDALVFPQMFMEIPKLDSVLPYPNTVAPQINILGTPGITVPAGYYKSGAPFSIIFLGKMWAEADLLGMAYAYEQATQFRSKHCRSVMAPDR